MSDPPDTPATTISADARRDVPAGIQHQRWLELCLVLLVAFGGSGLESFYILINAWNPGQFFSSARLSIGLLKELTALLLLAYVLSRRGLCIRNLGLRWSWKDAGAGLVIIFISYGAYILGSSVVRLMFYRMSWVSGYALTGGQLFAHPYSLAAISYSLLNPFFEELIVRAYLMTEVSELTGSRALAIVTSVVVQGSYHSYQGLAGAISLSFLFLVFALYYAFSRRALPIILAHGFFDIWALITFR